MKMIEKSQVQKIAEMRREIKKEKIKRKKNKQMKQHKQILGTRNR